MRARGRGRRRWGTCSAWRGSDASMAGSARGYNRAMKSADPEMAGLAPGGAVGGTISVPGSKSIAQRALVLAALAGGETRIAGLPDGDDVRAAVAAIEAAGARVERLAPAALRIAGRPPGPHRGWAPEGGLEAGESGTLARLATAALALCGRGGRGCDVRVRGTLRARTSRALFPALRS